MLTVETKAPGSELASSGSEKNSNFLICVAAHRYRFYQAIGHGLHNELSIF